MITGVHLHLETPNPIDPGITVRVEITRDNRSTATCFQEVYDGVEVDLLQTLASDIAGAFLYGERGAIEKAARSNRRVARQHAKEHDYT